MNEEKVVAAQGFLSGCAGAGCMVYLIGFILFILFIVGFALVSTPNPY
jgi:hypothetical protein